MAVRKNWADRTTNFECDMCGDVYEAEGVRFEEALDEFKDAGGVARLDAGEWMHFCEDCK